ncbi:MAG: molecular chaperone DnaK [Candidatus Thermoplasmatota archaeon]|nr:molecular chaperone DnaK [Candidatus Thermoplasmatota archaeon]
MAKIVGIDLGTTNSEAAIMQGGRPTIIPSAEGSTYGGKMFPSVVAFSEEDEVLVGEPARRQAVLNPESTVMQIKRKMGTDYTVEVEGKKHTPQEISSMILRKIKTDAEAFLGDEVKQAVITVPAYFNDNQRQATKDAGTIAGLEVLRLINEPTAAAIAYGFDKEEQEAKIAVLDLGGGTFDVTLMEIGEGVFQVESTGGDTHLGGLDMDSAITDHILGAFQKKEGIDLRGDRKAMQRVRDAAEKAKIELSGTTTTTVNLPFIAQKEEKPIHLEMDLSRSKLEQLVEPVLQRTVPLIRQAFKDAGWSFDDVQHVILVGGPTRMPVVREHFEKVIGRKAEQSVDPMQCVAMGAAIQGAVLAGEVTDILLLDVTPLSLGAETLGAVLTKLIDRNTTIPTKKTEIFTTAEDGQTTVEIHILQGERPMAADNISLGRFHLTGIPPAPRGVPQIEVTYDIDASGILHVSAKDLGTGKEEKLTITAPQRLSEKEKEHAIRDAEKYAEQDRKRRELADTKNQADALIYSTEKMLKEMENKVSEDTRKAVKRTVDALKEALESDEIQKLKKAIEDLNTEAQKVGSEVYQKAQAERAQSEKEGGEAEPSEADVVDADFEDVDDKG